MLGGAILVGAVIVAVAILVTAGGGGQGGDQPQDNAYQHGYEACAAYPLQSLAGFMGTSATPDAVAAAVAEVTPGTPAERETVRRGCLAALADAP
jgi:hypothetical protein